MRFPWFDNPEGLFYRTDLIKTPPTSPAQVVADAQTAMKEDKSLKEGLAFEGVEVRGRDHRVLDRRRRVRRQLDPQNVNTAGNAAALTVAIRRDLQ